MTDAAVEPVTEAIVELPDRCGLRIPQLGATYPLEDALARWNAGRQAASRARVAATLVGIDVDAWADRGEQQPTAANIALTADEATILDRLRVDRVEAVTDGAGGPWRAARVADLLPSLAILADDLAAVLQARVDIDVLVGDRRPTSTDWHDHDVLLVGLEGTTGVTLHGPTATAPLHDATSGPSLDAAWTGALGPGDALLVPRGWGHEHRSEATAAWAEIALRRQRGTDVAAFVAARAGGAEPFREDAPWDPTSADPAPTSIFGDPNGLHDRFVELDLDHLALVATAWWAATLRPIRPASARSLPGRGDLAGLRLVAPGGVVLVTDLPHEVDDLPDGLVALAAAGHLLRLAPGEVLPLLDGTGPHAGDLLAAGLLRQDAP